MQNEKRTGTVTQILGPVLDVRFDGGNLPPIFTALTITNPSIDDRENNLVLEVTQHIGDNTVRAIAMDSTEGLQREFRRWIRVNRLPYLWARVLWDEL